MGFSKNRKDGFSKYGIEHVGSHDIVVISNTRQILKDTYLPRVIAYGYLADYISDEDLSRAFDNMGDVDLKEAYKAEKWEATFQYQIDSVLYRLWFVEKLSDILNESKEKIILAEPINGLITYLLMTCCDKLGQPYEFTAFNDWLKSKKSIHLKQKDEALKKIDELRIIDPIEISKELAKMHLSYYGTAKSFHKFFDKCPEDLLNNFLSSFEVITFTLPISQIHNFTNEEKIELLFANRNSYTHNLSTLFCDLICPFLDQLDENQIHWYGHQRVTNSGIMQIDFNKSFHQSLIECIKNVLVNEILEKGSINV